MHRDTLLERKSSPQRRGGGGQRNPCHDSLVDWHRSCRERRLKALRVYSSVAATSKLVHFRKNKKRSPNRKRLVVVSSNKHF